MINRNIAPPLTSLSIPALLPYRKTMLDNGIEIVYIHDPAQKVFKIDFVFEAGIYYQPQPLIASAAIHMLNEGTNRHRAEEIADLFDYYGAYVDFSCGLNKSEVSLISLNKYAEETLSMLSEILTDSTIPDKELDIFLTNRRQEFLVNNEKTAYLARKKFSELLFGSDHPYANRVTEKDFAQVTASPVRKFYHRHINARNCRIVACGNVNDHLLQTLSAQFSRLTVPAQSPEMKEQPFTPARPGVYHISKTDSIQSSIRMGKAGVRLTEPDYAGFMLLNTILGGYFGSRLMSNIREEKGYTYGIHSLNVSMPQGSSWYIATDVNNEYVEATLAEIQKEIRILQTQPVPEEELLLVKNFLHGELLREVDGVFSQSDALKHKLNYGLDNRFYSEIIRQINACRAEDLLELARKYLNTEEMYIVTAGK